MFGRRARTTRVRESRFEVESFGHSRPERLHEVALPQRCRGEDVTHRARLLVPEEGDVGRPSRVVLDPDYQLLARLASREIDESHPPLVTSAAGSRRDPAVVVPASRRPLGLGQVSVRSALVEVFRDGLSQLAERGGDGQVRLEVGQSRLFREGEDAVLLARDGVSLGRRGGRFEVRGRS